jgi:hypothetical protein
MQSRCGRTAALGLLGVALVAFAGCTQGVSKAELDAVKQQLAAKEQELTAARQQVAELQKPSQPASGVPSAALQGGAAAIPIYSASRVPPLDAPAPPVPQPVPVPPGLPASYTEPVGQYAMYLEQIAGTGPSKYGMLHGIGCVQENVFKRGMKMVWRLELYDVTTGTRVTPQDQAIVKIKLSSGDELPMNFSRRGGPQGSPDAPWMWVTAWHIPPEYALGEVEYSVLVIAQDGKITTLKPPLLKGFTALRVID